QVVAVEFTNDPKSPRGEVLQRVKDLEQLLHSGRISAQERINLSTYYVRLNEPQKAINLLNEVPERQRDWMLWSNLATAYQLTGNLDRAATCLSFALENWPQVSTVTTSGRLNWLRIVEKFHLKLIQSRLLEQRRPGSAESVDPLFPSLQFVGPS